MDETVRRDDERLYRMLTEEAQDIIFVIGRDRRFEHVNSFAARRLGSQPEDLLGQPGTLLFPPGTCDQEDYLRPVFETGEPTYLEHKTNFQGREVWLYTSLSAVKGPEGRVTAVLGISRDITEFVRMREELRTLSLVDELTGLYNRRALSALAEQQLQLADRMKKGIAVLVADLDGMKQINDTHGHRVGDAALVATATVLKQAFRQSDIIARISGDEFVVLAIWVSALDLGALSARLDRAFEFSNEKGDYPFHLSLSYGIAHYDPTAPRSLEELLEQADTLMYQQKQAKTRSRA